MTPSPPFAALQFAADYGIHVGSVTGGFANIACPFCDGSTTSPYPLGLHLSKGYASCFRCGYHPMALTISKTVGSGMREAQQILDDYSYKGSQAPKRSVSGILTCPLPGGPITPPFREYLASRGLDPDWISLEHGVLSAGPRTLWHGESRDWDGQWFSDRLIIPIHDQHGTVVAFQGRSIQKDAVIRYKVAQPDKVPMHYKRTLYGHRYTRQDLVVVVEGVVDQWKLGRGVVATFGTTVTEHQIRLLGKFRRVLFAFDSENTAQEKATRAAREVASLGVKAEVVDLELGNRDAGDLETSEIGPIRRELGLD